jgi:hypothetical protein
MRFKGIIMLASIAILVATGMGNAFATVWYPGYPLQSEDFGTYARFLTTGTCNEIIIRGTSLGWYNQFINGANAPDVAYLNYWTYPISGELSLSTYPVSIPNGEDRIIGFSGPTAGHVGDEIINANHAYEGNGFPRATSTWSGLTFQEY